MRAIVSTRYGSPTGLQLHELSRPVPKDDEVRIRVHATTVTSGDVVLQSLPLLLWLPLRVIVGLRRKRIPGSELAGEIEAVGRDVERFRTGDQVFAATGMSVGSCAEYVCLPERAALARKPINMTYDEAAAVPVGGSTALHYLREADLQSGHQALVYGASGSVGTFAVQLAKALGANVTGVCSTANLALVASLGADQAIDYTREDFAARGERYDVIFDAVGKASSSDCRRALTPDGTYVTVTRGIAKPSTEDLIFLRELIEAGKVKSAIDRRYPLEKTAEAHRYVRKGHKVGNIVITLEHHRTP